MSFDGSVLETWQPGNEGTGRLHAAVIKSVNLIRQGRDLFFMEIDTVYRTGTISFSLPADDQSTAEELKQLIENAVLKYR